MSYRLLRLWHTSSVPAIFRRFASLTQEGNPCAECSETRKLTPQHIIRATGNTWLLSCCRTAVVIDLPDLGWECASSEPRHCGVAIPVSRPLCEEPSLSDRHEAGRIPER